VLLAGVGAAVSATQPALAQRGSEVTVEVSDCLALEAPAERLACFERRVEQAQGRPAAAPASPPPAAAAPPAPAARAPVPADDDSFGLPTQRPSRRDERAEREAQEAREARESRGAETPVREIVAKVVAVRETVPNYRTITLDNGQIWRQNRAEFLPLRPGHEVRISAGKFGSSLRLFAPQLRGDIQVERVR
jgi:hypothetical protein